MAIRRRVAMVVASLMPLRRVSAARLVPALPWLETDDDLGMPPGRFRAINRH